MEYEIKDQPGEASVKHHPTKISDLKSKQFSPQEPHQDRAINIPEQENG